MGIVTRSSTSASTSGGRPLPSAPIKNSVGPSKWASTGSRPPRGTAATIRQRAWRAPESNSSRTGARQVGRRKALPIDPRRAFHPNGSADRPAAATPLAPPASATRTMAPRFPGSCTLTAATTSGDRPANAVAARSAGRSASATTALGDRTGLSASMTEAEATATSTSRASRRDRSAALRSTASVAMVTWRSTAPASRASCTRRCPSTSRSDPWAPRAAARYRATRALCRLVIRFTGIGDVSVDLRR